MLGGDSAIAAAVTDPGERRTKQRGAAPNRIQMENDCRSPRASIQKHLVVVAQERDQRASLFQRDQSLDHTPAVRTTVDVIAQRDDHVVGPGLDRLEQGFQGSRTTVDVADGDRSRRHDSPLNNQDFRMAPHTQKRLSEAGRPDEPPRGR